MTAATSPRPRWYSLLHGSRLPVGRCLLASFALLFLLTIPASAADLLEGRVVRIADGDTLTVLDADQVQHRVRLGRHRRPREGPTLRRALEAEPGPPRRRQAGRDPLAQAGPLRPGGRPGLGRVSRRPLPGRRLPEDAGRRPRPGHGRARLALQAVRRGAERGGPGAVRLRRGRGAGAAGAAGGAMAGPGTGGAVGVEEGEVRVWCQRSVSGRGGPSGCRRLAATSRPEKSSASGG